MAVDVPELLRKFYQAIDDKQWRLMTSLLTADCRWHILANDVVDPASVTGPSAVAAWFASALGAVETRQEIVDIVRHDAGAAVFT